MAASTSAPHRNAEVYGQRQSFELIFDVQLVPQEHSMSCWAAAAAMVVGWSQQMSIPDREIARRIGYWRQYAKPAHQGGGLDPEDEAVFEAWGMRAEEPQSFTAEAFYDLFATYGPLWVAAMVGGAHVRVIYGMAGDGTPDGTTLYIHDPSGVSYQRSYTQFVAEMEQLASQELQSYDRPLYVAHMREPIASTQATAQRAAMGARGAHGCVVIDAGHGGYTDAGRSTAHGVQGPDGAWEKDITLALARSVAEHTMGPVVLTRDRDVNLSLAERCAVAREYGARAFVSIHANGSPYGSEAYVHPRANAGSRVLARAIQRRVAAYGAASPELQQAPMAVLTPQRLPPDTAACLIEVDCLPALNRGRALHEPGVRELGMRELAVIDRLGAAIARGVEQFLGDGRAAVPARRLGGREAERAARLSRPRARALARTPTIVLDPGHGGDKKGCEGPSGTLEKDVTLEIAKLTQEELESVGYRVPLTRDRDEDLTLTERAEVAVLEEADGFVSIHLNAGPWRPYTETLVHHSATSTDDSWLLAECVQARVVTATGLRDRGVQVHVDSDQVPVENSVLTPNRHPGIPACLVEVSFLTDPDEELRLSQPEYRREIARALAQGIIDFIERRSN